MPDIDPITREALRRAAHMHNYAPKNPGRRPEPEHTPPPEPQPTEHEHFTPPMPEQKPPETDYRQSGHKHSPSESGHSETSTGDRSHSPLNGVLKSLFNDKEQSIILLLIILLMGEDSSPSLLLALLYLLI